MLWGVVTDEAGNPLAGAVVFVVRSISTVRDVAAITNEKGEYRLTSIPTGAYELSAVHDAYVTASTTVQLHSTQPVAVNFKLRKHQ
ncbi:MAG: carboxypeptidase-like regulatory domain-containing protein [Caldilineaceae bacterium]